MQKIKELLNKLGPMKNNEKVMVIIFLFMVICWVFGNYFNFHGRARRSEYWWFYLLSMVVAITALIFDTQNSLPYFTMLYLIIFITPSLSLQTRRLHDTNKSAWLLLLYFVPLINIALLVMATEQGHQGINKYGPDPKVESHSPLDRIISSG